MIYRARSGPNIDTFSIRSLTRGLCKPGGVDSWLIGLIALCVVGIAVIGFGAFWDRRRHRQEVAEMLSPPERDIPHLPADAGAPAYLPGAQARRRPPRSASRSPQRAAEGPPSTELDALERAEVARQLVDNSTVCIPVGYASGDFVTDSSSKAAILDRPRVLVSAEPVMAIRELIGPLEHMMTDQSAVVIVAPSMTTDVLKTLQVNQIQQRLRVLVVLDTDPEPADTICSVTQARLIDRVDLQSGYVTDADLGFCHRWISYSNTTYLIQNPDDTEPESGYP